MTKTSVPWLCHLKAQRQETKLHVSISYSLFGHFFVLNRWGDGSDYFLTFDYLNIKNKEYLYVLCYISFLIYIFFAFVYQHRPL